MIISNVNLILILLVAATLAYMQAGIIRETLRLSFVILIDPNH